MTSAKPRAHHTVTVLKMTVRLPLVQVGRPLMGSDDNVETVGGIARRRPENSLLENRANQIKKRAANYWPPLLFKSLSM